MNQFHLSNVYRLLMCTLLAVVPGAGSWDTVGDENGSAVGDMISKQPFYSSGPDAEFTLINGGYQPVVDVQVCLTIHL